MEKSDRKRCAIIGAGASGLPSARWALAYGIEPVIFERDEQIGGLWRFKPQETEMGSVMRSTIINTSKELLAYSDFPPSDKYANYMHNSRLLEYFVEYAKHHNLLKYIRFRHRVINIRRADDYAETGRWQVDYRISDGDETTLTETFDCVLLCQGHHAIPNLVGTDWPGKESFGGRIMHAHSYKDYRGFEGSRTVVVGIGNSALDIAVELSHVCKEVHLSTRRGAWVLNRVSDGGQPLDIAHLNRFKMLYLPRWLPYRLYESLWINMVQRRFDHEKYGLKPAHGFFSQHLTINDDLPNRLISGRVQLRPDVKCYVANDGIEWSDGTVTEHVDNVVLATGYTYNFEMIERGRLVTVRDNFTPLYKYIFPVELASDVETKRNTLGIIGLIQPIGSIMPISEMQARVFFEAFTGRLTLPSRDEMLADVECRRAEIAARYVASPRHTIQVDYLPYIEELAETIGCRPNIARYAFTDPRLAARLVFGPSVAYGYRLSGPHPWPGARRAVMDAEQRAQRALCPGRNVGNATENVVNKNTETDQPTSESFQTWKVGFIFIIFIGLLLRVLMCYV